MIIENENTYLIFTYFRGNLISRKWDGYISRDLNFAICLTWKNTLKGTKFRENSLSTTQKESLNMDKIIMAGGKLKFTLTKEFYKRVSNFT